MDALIERHFRAEERGDVDGAIADFSDSVDHELAGSHRATGKEGARGFYQALFGRVRLIRIISERRLYGENFAVDQATVEAQTLEGRPAPFRLLHVFEFNDGAISRECAWQAPVGTAGE